MKPFVKYLDGGLLRRGFVVCCGPKEQVKRLFLDPKTFAGLALTPKEHGETWAYLEGAWDRTIGNPVTPALGAVAMYKGDVFILMAEWDSRVFVHEAYHATRKALCAINTDDEELGAYLVEWLFEQICWPQEARRENEKRKTKKGKQ